MPLRCYLLAFVFVAVVLGNAAPVRSLKVRVSDPVEAQALLARGGRVIADYGGFQLIEASPSVVEQAELNRAEVEEASDIIELNAQVLDTRSTAAQAQHGILALASGRRLHLVQFAGPIKPEWYADLENLGLRPVTYVPHNAYLVYGEAAALSRMQAWASTNELVQWEGLYADDYKIHPNARTTDAWGNPLTPAADTFAIQLLDDPEVNTNTLALIDSLKLEEVQNQFRTLEYLNVIVRVPAERLLEIAARPDVVSIQAYVQRRLFDERQDQIMAGNLVGGQPTGPGYLAWLASKGFTQAQFTNSGFAVDVTDSGIDNGLTTPGHFGLYPQGDTTRSSRVIYNRLFFTGKKHTGSTMQGCDGHGTLNSHIIAGYNDLGFGFPHTDSAGYRYGLGVCPFVKVGSSVIFDPDTFTNPNYNYLQSQAYQSGVRVSNNSWGANTAGAYDVDAQSYDSLVRDAQPTGSTYPTSGNQQMVIVFAAGNAGPGAQTVGSPGTAKNIITVGASENVRSLSTGNGGNSASGSDGCGTTDSGADNAHDIAGFSSRGPCSDGRMKPDLVAPGSHVSGGLAQNTPPPSTAGTGSAIACFKGTGVCGLVGGGSVGNANNYFPLSQQFYTVSSGTSHSAPAVAGACALIRQYFINNSLTPPNPAMTKAWLMNSTRYLTGASANDTLWSANQGLGLVNLRTAFDGVPRILRDQVAADKFTATGQTRTFTGVVADSTKPFRVTLAWTDAPGSTTGAAYKNNLNLTVTVGGVSYKGNVFNGAFSMAGGTADSKNNVENVFCTAGLSGAVTVTVTAANINSDGVPNEAPTLDQDFALVIYNAAVAADVGIGQTVSPAAGGVGTNFTFSLSVTNFGSADASSVKVTNTLPAGFSFVSASASQGTASLDGAVVTFALGALTNGGTATLAVHATAVAAGEWTNSADVFSELLDTNRANNTGAVIVSVASGNSPPIIAGLVDVTVAEGTVAGPLAFTIGDAETAASALTLAAFVTNSNLVPPANIVFEGSDSNRTVTITPAPAQFGQATITVEVSDGTATASQSFVLHVNSPPTLAPIGSRSAAAGMPLAFTVVASDPDGDPLNFSLQPGIASGVPAGAAIDPATGLFTWTPTESQVGTNVITVRVTDGNPLALSASESFTVEVVLSNNAPVLSPIANQTTAVGLTLAFTNHATDLDSPPQVLQFSLLSGAVTNASLNSASGLFTWTPTEAEIGTNLFHIVVGDNGLPPMTATQHFAVVVQASNQPPVLAPIASQTLHALMTLVVTNTATDPDQPAGTLEFSLASAPAGVALNATNGLLVWTPDDSQVGTHQITVRVSDQGLPHLSNAQTFAVAVEPRPRLAATALSSNEVTLSWNAIAGLVYRVQFQEGGASSIWSDIVPEVVAGGPVASQSDAISTNAFRLYRVRVVP